MWVERTQDEVTKWRASKTRAARRYGVIFAGSIWVAVSIMVIYGWSLFSSGGVVVAVQRDISARVWWVMPGAILMIFPIIYFCFRQQSKSRLREYDRFTICPKCDSAGDNNAGAPCRCGGTFVPSSTVRWVE
jgi:hypothetical protein